MTRTALAVPLIELQVLAGLAEGKLLSDIASELSVGQPALSKALRSARRRLGIDVVERRGKRLFLSPDGVQLAAAAHRALEQVDAVEELADDMRRGRRGRLRILATHTPGAYLLPPIVARFLRAFPAVNLEMDSTSVVDNWTAPLLSTHDLAVGPRPDNPQDWELEELYRDRLRFVVSRDSPLAELADVSWQDVSNQPLIGPFRRGYWARLLPSLQAEGFVPGPEIGVHGLEGIKQLVGSGDGIGLLFETALRHDSGQGHLAALPLASPALVETFYLIRRPAAPLSPVTAEFRAFLLDEVRKSHPPRPAGAS